MGMYTEIYVNVDFKKDTPKDVIETIKDVCDGSYDELSHKGCPDRWCMLFGNGSYYTPNTSVSDLTYDSIGENFSLLGKGDIKNYYNEIEAFFEFISPWVDSYESIPYFIGYLRYEEEDFPTLVYVEDGQLKYKKGAK